MVYLSLVLAEENGPFVFLQSIKKSSLVASFGQNYIDVMR
jgi:hypothetical protein